MLQMKPPLESGLKVSYFKDLKEVKQSWTIFSSKDLKRFYGVPVSVYLPLMICTGFPSRTKRSSLIVKLLPSEIPINAEATSRSHTSFMASVSSN